MLEFKRVSNSPFLVPKIGSAAPDAVTTPDILELESDLWLYVGAVAGKQERIIAMPFPLDALPDGSTSPIPDSAKVVLEPGPAPYDIAHVFDPALISMGNKVLIFYSAIGVGQDSIGLAESTDGLQFSKRPSPLLLGRSPEICRKDGNLILFFVKRTDGSGYSIHTAHLSLTGELEQEYSQPVLSPGMQDSWDGFEVTTPRIFQHHNTFYMLFAGVSQKSNQDIPCGFGLARSSDLIHWQKYPHNPVFELGTPGSWDDGAVWFGTVFEWQENLYLVYEGGRLENILDHSPALTNVGLAKLSSKEFDNELSSWD